MTIASIDLLQPCSSQPDREGQDRLEILTALLDGPSFDPIFRPDVIDVPPDHPVYRWVCTVADCERPRSGTTSLCGEHEIQWSRAAGGWCRQGRIPVRRNGFAAVRASRGHAVPDLPGPADRAV